MFNQNPEDRINNVVKAIAFAEGCIFKNESYNIHSLPYRLNNPCDLKLASDNYHGHMDGSGKLKFPDLGTGWNAGYHQVWLWAVNKSHICNANMMFQEIANHYAKENNTPKEQLAADNWAKNVCAFLDITTDVTLNQYLHPMFETLHGETKQISPPSAVEVFKEETKLETVRAVKGLFGKTIQKEK